MIRAFARRMGWRQTLIVLSAILSGAMLLSCHSTVFTYQGARIAQVSLIPLPEDAAKDDHFETEDVAVDYGYARSGNSLQLSGVISYSSALQKSFPTVPDFFIRTFFTDAQGTVLGYRGIVVSGYGYTSDRMRFQEFVTLPPGTAFMAFGYSGQARESSSGEAVVKSFWFDPIIH